jgi:hypothetical protein
MTREELIVMADVSGLSYYGMGKDREQFIAHLQRFADIVAGGAAFAEREACAKVCDAYANGLERNYSEIIADTIRARGQA